MDFDTDSTDEDFRAEVREFIAQRKARHPEDFRYQGFISAPTRDVIERCTRALNDKGWLVTQWPAEHGGRSWAMTKRRILEEELAIAGAPPTDTIGTGFVGPLLCRFGSPSQKSYYLPRIRNGEHQWCQGFSEPGAGSDTLSVQTSARRDNRSLVVNGTKVWISNGHTADMMFALVRAESPSGQKQQGLTFVLIDMKSAGLTVRPIITIDGRHHLNEVRFDNVRVPIDNVVGEQGRGWVYARSLLTDERTIVAGVGLCQLLLVALREVLSSEKQDGRLLIEDLRYRLRLVQFEAELDALEFMELRLLHSTTQDRSQLLAPMLKLRGCELRQKITECTMEALGEKALEEPRRVDEDVVVPAIAIDSTEFCVRNFLFTRAATIAGGTSEIQRNIIAAVGLGL
jgi:acyl-CoA dehydrogenase